MKKIFLVFLSFAIVFIAGCIPQNQDNEEEQNTQGCPDVCSYNYRLANNNCIEECGSGCDPGPDNIQTFSTLQECEARVQGPATRQTPTQQPPLKEFIVEADDNGLYPSTITINQGDRVKITFVVRTNNVYYGGLDFRSDVFNTGKIMPGTSTIVEFTAQQTFTYRSYWPSSNVLKATGTIIVT